jgi:hypothetical protein
VELEAVAVAMPVVEVSDRVADFDIPKYPVTSKSIVGIIEFGSVPVPPRNPKSCIEIQVAMHNTTAPTNAGRLNLGG